MSERLIIAKEFKNEKAMVNLKTFSTRMVAGELTTDSFLFLAASTSGGSSRGFEDAEVAVNKTINQRLGKLKYFLPIAKAAAAVDVLLLNTQIG